jgi:hypothetical protein
VVQELKEALMPENNERTIIHPALASQVRGIKGSEKMIMMDLPAVLVEAGLGGTVVTYVRVEAPEKVTFMAPRGTRDRDLYRIARRLSKHLATRLGQRTIIHSLLASQVRSINGGTELAREELVKMLSTASYINCLGITFEGVGEPHKEPDKVMFSAPAGMTSQLLEIADDLCPRLETRRAERIAEGRLRQLQQAR